MSKNLEMVEASWDENYPSNLETIGVLIFEMPLENFDPEYIRIGDKLFERCSFG